MRKPRTHARIVQYPFAHLLQGARLDSYQENDGKLIFEIHGFKRIKSELIERNGKIYEHINGEHIPIQLIFSGISKLNRSDFFTSLENYAIDDPSRIIGDMLSWRQPKRQDVFYLFGMRGLVDADMSFLADQVIYEKRKGGTKLIKIERGWSPPPPMPDRLVPQPKQIHRRFGGDPITARINNHSHHGRLYIGGIEIQPKQRPQVDAVLNLGEESSRWLTKGQSLHSNDRAVNKGEGEQGMTIDEIREEANWVIERLKDNQRVLVHCVAGMNRSSTICCAILILLEGLSAEKALARVREHHPWARPDSNHWLKLRWLAKNK
jgi:hypothetical protein